MAGLGTARRGQARPGEARFFYEGLGMIGVEPQHVNCTMLLRREERYVLLWRRSDATELLKLFGKFAVNAELSFTWLDAATLSHRVREELRKGNA